MKILYIHQYFLTPRQRGGTRSFQIARYLISRGHEVTMITSGRANEEFSARDDSFREYTSDGIRIIAINAGYNDARAGTAMSGTRRLLSFHAFARLATRIGKSLSTPDIVFATSTPLMVGLAGRDIARHFRRPFIFEVRDLWPDALINIGALRNPAIIWYLRRMERAIYSAADHVLALSPGMKQGVCRQGVDERDVTVIPNFADLETFQSGKGSEPISTEIMPRRSFRAVYFGAMGHANGLDLIVDAAAILKRSGDQRIGFIMAGDGGAKDHLRARCRNEGLDNVAIIDGMPREEVARLVASCDACLVIFRASKETSWSPNKLFDSMAAGRPIIINVGDWLGRLVRENDCGRVIDATSPQGLVEALIEFVEHPESTERMGRNARQLAERDFDSRKLASKLEEVMLRLSTQQSQHS